MGCDAFLGGISKNYANNLLLSDRGKNILVVEADEYDRSFLFLNPNLAIITSIDADHLDIFGTHEEVKNAFRQFVGNIKPNGVVIVKKGLEWVASHRPDVKVFTYSTNDDANFNAQNIEFARGYNSFNIETPNILIEGITLGVLGRYNIENALAAAAAAVILGATEEDIIGGLESFKGVSRRFDLRFSGKKITYIDDYAHHPEELKAAILSAREMFPGRTITGIFQPHLYSRTRDFANEFAESLSHLDELILTDIYPAREEPIPGVTPQLILENVTCAKKTYCSFENIPVLLKELNTDVLLTMGAGNIDKLIAPIVEILKEKEK
jgi:UDP-N-acetylmuramate--alanine ligase